MISSDIFFEEADASYKEFQSLRVSKRKESENGIIGPWNLPKHSSSPRKQDKEEPLFQLSKRKRSSNKPLPTTSANEERSMVITRRLNTHVVEFIDQQKFLKRRHFEQSHQAFTLRSFQIMNICPEKLSQSLKHPAEPTYISQFKYKQHRIRVKKASFDTNQPQSKKEKMLNLIPSLDRSHLQGRKGKILSLGYKKIFNQRLHSETSEIQRKQMQKMFKSHLF